MANTTGKKFGGRKKGTPNKDKQQLLDMIRKEVGDNEYHPVVEMARQAINLRASLDAHTFKDELAAAGKREGVDSQTFLTAAEKHKLMHMANKEVASYVAPKLKAVEFTGDDGGALTVVIKRFS